MALGHWLNNYLGGGNSSGSGGGNIVYCPLRSEGPYYYAEKTTRELAQAETIIFEVAFPSEYGGGAGYYVCVGRSVSQDGGLFNLVLPGVEDAARMVTIGAAMDDYPTNDPQAGAGGN